MRPSLVLLSVVVFGSGCPSPQNTCSPASCKGCCSADGTCQTGFDDNACGSSGTGCMDCQASAASCNALHVCLAGSGAGGGQGHGGGSGGAGGATGGGNHVGVSDQELISGSRLKAVRFIGPDGAQASYGSVFWDTQLSIACSPSTGAYVFASYYQLFLQQDLGQGRCYPTLLAYDFGLSSITGGGGVFGDAQCTQPLTYGMQSFYAQYFGRASGPPSPMGIFSPANVKYGLRPTDGGLYTGKLAHATLHTGGLWSRLTDGGCAVTQNDGGFDYYSLGADVPDTDFAQMDVTIDP